MDLMFRFVKIEKKKQDEMGKRQNKIPVAGHRISDV
jgi:hypothetical protein